MVDEQGRLDRDMEKADMQAVQQIHFLSNQSSSLSLSAAGRWLKQDGGLPGSA